MAGMFYSLQEAAERLNKSEDEVKKLVGDGRLREFRDGPNLLFKVDEVEALMSDTSVMASQDSSAKAEQQAEEDEISLAPEVPKDSTAPGGLTAADTAVTDEGTDLLGDTESGLTVADDTITETKAESDIGEASLEEIEEDVNLDTFGSGSGLLDLSLQADDTSLGGILDEIYTPEGEEGQAPAEADSAEVAADAEQMISEEKFVGPEPAVEAPAVVRAYAEPQPDAISNAFGYMLFLPLLVVIYTAIVAVAGLGGTMPVILVKILDIGGPNNVLMIWYVMLAVAVAAGLVIGAAFMGSSSGTKTAKPKVKKKKKAKKEKKGKKPKS